MYPQAFELGNAYLSIPMAAIVSGFLLTILLYVAKGVARSQKYPKKGRYFMFGYYWLLASASVWVIARIASVSGFGIARYTWAVGVGFLVTLVHWVARQAFKGVNLVDSK